MDLNDLKIKQLIRTLKDGGDDFADALDEIKKETGLYIYSFPAMAYRKDRDVCSDFYLYLLERLDRVLVSYPCEAEIRFKTWFNYVLRNQFHNFHYYREKSRKDIPCVSLDCGEDEVPARCAELEEDDSRYGDLELGMGKIGEWDRALIRFFYMPETVRGDDVKRAVTRTGLSAAGILGIVRELIVIRRQDLERKRETAEKIGVFNRKLTEMRYKLVNYRGREISAEELARMNGLMEKIARLESGRSRLVRALNTPDRKATVAFSRLFQDRPGAVRRLDLARNKLRFEMLKLKRTNEKVG